MNLRITAAARYRRSLAVLCAAATASTSLVAFAAPSGDAALDNSLAERMAMLADDMTVSPATPQPILRQAAALLDLARERAPQEVRFARSSASVLLRLGESDRALAALAAVRAIDPKDQLAMIQYVDLTANAMESADGRLAYLQQVVDAQKISAEVRSHAAVSMVDLLYQRAEDGRAAETLDKALALNPQNITALTMKYQTAIASGDKVARAQAISGLLQASPANADWLTRAARECIASGHYEGAHSFYESSFGVHLSRGENPSVDDLLDLTGSELLGGSATDISPLLKQALTAIKMDGRLYSADLLASEYAGSKAEDLAPAIAAARGVYLAQLAGVSQRLNQPTQKEMPATSPAVPFPNVTADAAKIVAADPDSLRTAYTVALAEQLWFDLFFRAAAVDDASISALATLLGDESDPLIVRLQGWKLLSDGHADEAKVKLSAVADRDGYAKLGLAAVAASQGKADESKAALTELLTARPDGMLAIFTALAAKTAGVTVEKTPAEIAVAKTLDPFRRTTSDFISNSRASYLMTATPVNVSFGPGDVLLARVTLQNNGRYPITIGPGAYIDSNFMVDFSVHGDSARTFPAVSVGKWAGAVRLVPQQSISQVIRLDRGPAYAFLRQYPTPVMTLGATVTTNAFTRQTGSYPGAGGQQTAVGSVMERKPSPLFVEAYRAKVIDQIANGKPLERLNAMELTCAVLPLLAKQEDNPDAKTVATTLRAALDAQVEKEPIADIKAWAIVSRATTIGGVDGLKEVAQVSDLDAPMAKVASLVVARALPKPQRQQLAKHVLESAPTGPIAELAQGVLDQPDPPTTQPTTRPADGATGGPGTDTTAPANP